MQACEYHGTLAAIGWQCASQTGGRGIPMLRHATVTVLVSLVVIALGICGCNLLRPDAEPDARPMPGPRPQTAPPAAPAAPAAQVEPLPREDFSKYEPKPIPSGPDAKTDADFEPIRMKWARRISIDLYRERGMRDPRWDKEAEALLEAYAQFEGCGSDKPTIKEFAQLADALVETECPDPLVRLAAGSAFFLAKRYEDAYANVFCPNPPGGPDHPDIAMVPKHALGWQIHCQVNPDQTGHIDGSYSVFRSNVRSGISETELTGDEPRAVYHWLEHKMDEMERRRYAEMAEDIRRLQDRSEVDPWLLNMILGYLELNVAWEARGGGFATEVSEAGWEGFDAHLTAAGNHFMTAHDLHPEWPEAAALMVQVSTGEEGASRAGRAWFDRAVAAQMDFADAYSGLVWQLMPRWGGSHKQLWELATECMETKRYDTEIPWRALEIAETIVIRDGATDFVADRDVYRALLTVFRGYLNEPDPGVDAKVVKTLWAAIASAGGHHADVVRLLDELGDDVERARLLSRFGRTPLGLRREAELGMSPHKQKLDAARSARASGDHGRARRLYREVLAASPGAGITGYAQGGLRASEVEEAFAAGKTVELIPGFTPDQCVEVIGHWEVAVDGAVVHHPKGEEQAQLLFPPDIRDNYRLVANIVFAADDDRAMAGLVLNHGWPNVGLQSGAEMLMADRYAHKAHVGGDRVYPPLQWDVRVNRRMTLTGEIYRQTLAGWVDGRKVFSAHPLMTWYEDPEQQLPGILINYRGNVTEPLRFERLTLIPLTETPPGWEDPGLRLPQLTRPWAGKMPEGWVPSGPSGPGGPASAQPPVQ